MYFFTVLSIGCRRRWIYVRARFWCLLWYSDVTCYVAGGVDPGQAEGRVVLPLGYIRHDW